MLLADVNVWLATVVEDHPHHQAVLSWWRTVLADGDMVAFCRITQLGLVRLLCNRTVMGAKQRTVRQAWGDYQQIVAQPPIRFLHEPEALDDHLASFRDPVRSSPGFWTDAYLAAFARAAAVTLVTLDQGFRRFPDLELALIRT